MHIFYTSRRTDELGPDYSGVWEQTAGEKTWRLTISSFPTLKSFSQVSCLFSVNAPHGDQVELLETLRNRTAEGRGRQKLIVWRAWQPDSWAIWRNFGLRLPSTWRSRRESKLFEVVNKTWVFLYFYLYLNFYIRIFFFCSLNLSGLRDEVEPGFKTPNLNNTIFSWLRSKKVSRGEFCNPLDNQCG